LSHSSVLSTRTVVRPPVAIVAGIVVAGKVPANPISGP
jgi:hypothetical protein